eukprot:3191991-Prymnesium_polylepis.1
MGDVRHNSHPDGRNGATAQDTNTEAVGGGRRADDERTVGATVACAYERVVAEAGIAQWGDMLDAATGEI